MSQAKPDVGDEAIKAKTGRSWPEWIVVIDGFGGEGMTHKDIARKLHDDGLIAGEGSANAGWWAQAVTVGYEKLKGRRVLGETADAGFQVGVHKTVPYELAKVWEFILSPVGLELWVGQVPELVLEEKSCYQAKDGTTGEVRSFKELEFIRLTWQPPDWKEPSTLQLRLAETGPGKTRIGFHHERLAGVTQREQMKKHWECVAEDIERHLGDE